jgi:hypothetical protein
MREPTLAPVMLAPVTPALATLIRATAAIPARLRLG